MSRAVVQGEKRRGSCFQRGGKPISACCLCALCRFRGNSLWTQRGRLPEPQVPEWGRLCGWGEHLQLPLPSPMDRYVLGATSTGLLALTPCPWLQSWGDASATLKRKAVSIKTTSTRGDFPLSYTSHVDMLCKWINVFQKPKMWLCCSSCGCLLIPISEMG